MRRTTRPLRILVGASVAGLVQLLLPTAAFAAPGDLDPTFDGDGKATMPILNGASGTGTAIQGDGKIVVAGSAFNGTNYDFAVARFDPGGTPDPTFDGDGKAVAFFIMYDDILNDVAIQSDGKIVAAGFSGSDIALVRFKTNGTLDPTFSGDGKVKTDLGATEAAQTMAIQPDGKIVVAGWTGPSGGTRNFAVARYKTDGTLDGGFSRDGIVTTDFGGFDKAYGVAIQANGSIVVAGGTGTGACCDKFALARYKPNGGPDLTFDTDGRVTTDIGPSAEQIFSLALQPDQRIVVAGYSFNGTNFDFALARYTTGGGPDLTFSGDGKQIVDLGSGDTIFDIALQSDGKIVAAGDSGTPNVFHWALARFKTGGALDKNFSGDGRVTTTFGGSFETARAVALQSNGRIVGAGRTGGQFAVARYLAA
jgi:uncharacterized delta-60 repeat protein